MPALLHRHSHSRLVHTEHACGVLCSDSHFRQPGNIPKSPSCTPLRLASHAHLAATGAKGFTLAGASLDGAVGAAFTACNDLLITALAALVGNRAAGLASALAGALALTATAMGERLAQAGRSDGLEMLHINPSTIVENSYPIIQQLILQYNAGCEVSFLTATETPCGSIPQGVTLPVQVS